MHLLCPHCRNPIEVISLDQRAEISCPSCGSSFRLEAYSTADWAPLDNPKFGRFELLEEVGRGAFGTVYRARDPELDRIVAVKVPRAGNLAGKDDLDRFLREARSVAQLRHPSIVSVHEVGQQGTMPYLVSEYIPGITLADRISAGRLSIRAAAEIAAAVAEALHYAHEHGVVHRDVKPSNIMLESGNGDGSTAGLSAPTPSSPRLMDFGLAKREAGEIAMTVDGQVLGTPAYMAPEQAGGRSHQVDGRSDVYSVGVILYQMLTGELPFRGTTRMLLHQVLHDEPRPPRYLNDQIPRDLQTICLKCLAKEPQRRYASAAELAADLRRFLKGEPIQARPVGRLERTWRWCRRNPQMAGLAAALFLVTLVGVIGILIQWRDAVAHAEDARTKEEKAQEQTALAKKQAEEIEKINSDLLLLQEDQQHALNAANMKLIQFAWRANDVGKVSELLKKGIPAPGQKDVRHFEWHYWDRLVHGARSVVALQGGGLRGDAEFNPDQSLLADVVAEGKQLVVRLWDTRTGAVVRDCKGPALLAPARPTEKKKGKLGITLPAGGGRVVFSPDGRWLAAVLFFPSETGKNTGVAPGPGLWPYREELWVWDAQSGAELWHKPVPTATPLERQMRFLLTFDREGHHVAHAVRDRETGSWTVPLFARTDGRIVRTLSEPDLLRKEGYTSVSLALGPDLDEEVLSQQEELRPLKGATSPSGDLVLWDFKTKQEKWRISLFDGGRPALATWSPDRSRLAVHWHTTRPGTKNQVWIHDAATGKPLFPCEEENVAVEPMELEDAYAHLRRLQFSPDGKALLILAYHSPLRREPPPIRVHDAATGKLRHKVLHQRGRLADASFTAGGAWLMLAADSTVQVWPAAARAPFRVSKEPGHLVQGISLSGDGTSLAAGMKPYDRTGADASKPGKLSVFDVATGKTRFSVEDPLLRIDHIHLSADGTRLTALLQAQALPATPWENRLVVWLLDSRERLGSWPLPEAAAVKGRFGVLTLKLEDVSADGRRVAFTYPRAQGERVLQVWKLPEGKDDRPQTLFETTLRDDKSDGARFTDVKAQISRDGRLLVLSTLVSGSPVKTAHQVVNLETGKITASFEGKGTGRPFAISPTGNVLALSVIDRPREIMLADLEGKEQARLVGHTMPVAHVAFSPDGRRLASFGAASPIGPRTSEQSGEIRLWDVQVGQEVLSLSVATATASPNGILQFSSDGRRLFLGHRTGPREMGPSEYELHTWDATPLAEKK